MEQKTLFRKVIAHTHGYFKGMTLWSTTGSSAIEEAGSRAIAWRLLRWLNISRALIAGLLFSVFFAHKLPGDIATGAPTLFVWVALFYFIFALANSVAVARKSPHIVSQTILQISGDIIALTLLMYASHGVGSGLAAVLVVPIAAGALILRLRAALGFAALATIAILVQEVFVTLTHSYGGGHYVQAGLLGVVLFAITLLGHTLVQRLRESEHHAAQRGIDLANMAALNEYIIEQLRAGIIVLDGFDNVILTNPAAVNVLALGHTRHNTPLALIAPRLAALLNLWRSGTRAEYDLTITAPDDTTYTPHFTPLGAQPASGTIIFLEDASYAAEQVRQMKLASLGRLTGSIAHEIRNPLSAIGHASQLLGESQQLPDQDRRFIEIIDTHTRRVNRIVDNILKLSRAESVSLEDINITSWLNNFISEFREYNALDKRDVRMLATLQNEPLIARADASQLHQIIRNLAENALRHAPPGDVPHYSTRALIEFSTGTRPGHNQPYIEVLDHGPGIDAATIDQIFEPFYTSSSQGTGLGLFIARELCECNRATLSYHPRTGGGSCFRITFANPQSWVS